MTPDKIQALFFAAIQEKAVYNKLEGITRNQIYNWLNDRGQKPNLGNMLNVLYQLKLIEVSKITAQDIEAKKAWDAWGEKTLSPDDLRSDFGSIPSINYSLFIEGEPQPEIVLDKNGNKKILKPVTRPNSNSK